MKRRDFLRFLGGLGAAMMLPTVPEGFAKSSGGVLIPAAEGSKVELITAGMGTLENLVAIHASLEGHRAKAVLLRKDGSQLLDVGPQPGSALHWTASPGCGIAYTPEHPLYLMIDDAAQIYGDFRDGHGQYVRWVWKSQGGVTITPHRPQDYLESEDE